ncbi:MAG: nucleotide exchange factor GrpE [Candidatus Omnitrophica bacterium]|nr:nucleotide exchange factor GrpE [Candidatus Omnitrophota bacterium]
MTKQEKHEPNQEPETQEKTSVELARTDYEELLRKAAEFSELQNRLLRSAADFDNAKKRLAKERDEFIKFALEDMIHDLLPVLDHFELALTHLQVQDEKSKSIRDGFLLIQKQLLQTLTERGLRKIETLGKSFDPHWHEAVGHIVSLEKPEGVILDEILAGYELNGKLLRPAKVKVSVKEEKVSEEKAEELT